MSDSEVEIVEEKENGEPILHTVKQKMLRDSACFIRNAEKTYKHHMAHEKWKKLLYLANILESNMTPAEFITKFSDEKIRKIELIIADLKTKIETQWSPNDVIVINDDEPSASTASNKQAEEQSSTSTAKSTARASPIYLDLTSPPPAKKSLDFERRDSASTSIGGRQQDDVRNNINAATDSLVFSRRSKDVPSSTATVNSSFHEARRRLAELSGTTETMVLQSPPSPVPPPPSFNTNTPWSLSVGKSNNIPVMEFLRTQNILVAAITSPSNNNSNCQNYNMNLNNFNQDSGGCTVVDLPFDCSFTNSQNEPSMSRRYNNLRDPRCANLGNSNRPPIAAALQQQHQLQQQTFNCNYGYVMSDINNNGSNNIINNNQMIWNGINNTINPVIRHYPNFGNRPVYNHVGCGNNNPRQEPRTYGEYRLAKRQRQLEEAERQRQLKAAEKQRQLDDGVEAVISIDKDHLDTSYRNIELLNNNRRIDFKIPKKASLDRSGERKAPETESRVDSLDDVESDAPALVDNTATTQMSADSEQMASRHSLTLQETGPKSTLEVAWELATTTNVSLPIKRKRGRPRKKKQPTATENFRAKIVTSSVKRRRGRPPLLKKQPPATEVSNAAKKNRKRGRPFKKQPPARQTEDSSSGEDLGNVETDDSSSREDLGNVETEDGSTREDLGNVETNDSASRQDLAHPTSALSANSPASTTSAIVIPTTATPLASPPPKRKVRRNELDMLIDDIAEMYYGDDVLRATGRRACTTKKKKPPTPEPDSSCRRRRLNRASFKAKQKKKSTKRLRVRVTDIVELDQMLKMENMVKELKQEADIEEVLTNWSWTEPNKSPLAHHIDSIGMPPTWPEEEQLLVINECKIEQFEEKDKQGQVPQQEAPLTVAELQLKSEPELEIVPMPKLDILMADEPAEEEQLNLSLVVKEMEIREETQMEQEEKTEQEMDTEIISEPRPENKSKSIFRNYQKFCNKLKSGNIPTSISGGKESTCSVSDSEAPDLDPILDLREPSQQHLDWNAPGVGEFSSAKAMPLVINQTSELGLAINEVFSLADASIKSLVP